MESIPTKAARFDFAATRNDDGVPCIDAANWLEALYALGYMHAIDRPTQIFFSRAVASGQAAARIANKPELLETDRFFRRAGLHLRLDEEVEQLDPAIHQQLQSYCDGVNDALQEAGRTLPMLVTGFRPRPWDPESVLLLGNLLSFAGLAVAQQENERLLVDLIQTGIDPALLRELFEPYLDNADFEPLMSIQMERRLSDEALEMLADLPRLAGSNAWAVAPRRTESGSALLASDPHLEVNRLPCIWYEAVLRWGEGKYAMGATLPGCPLMAVGRTNQLAWGVTYLHADTSDYFIEDCRPRCGVWQYRRGGQWHDFRVREELIDCKGGESTTLSVFENDLGVMLRDLTGLEAGKYLSVKWVGGAEGSGRSIATWLAVTRARDARGAMDAAAKNPHPTLVWVFADRDGHIGRRASGWLPQRAPGRTGIIPLAAWDESNHWQGRIDDRLLPELYDPVEGYLASANENIDRADEFILHSHGLPSYRKDRIVGQLHQLHAATVDDMRQLQYDVVSLQARRLLQVFLPHVPEGDFKVSLLNWDCSYSPESRQATQFQHLYRHVILEIFGHSEGIGWRRMFYLSTRMGYSSMVFAAIDRLLEKGESNWWRNRDKGAMIRLAAERAMNEPAAPWGKVNSFHFANRFFEKSRVGRLLGFHTEKMPMPGCQATPFQGHLLTTATRESSFAPSYHFVTDLGRDEAHSNLPGGASESRFSKWYRTDILRWIQGEYRLLDARRVAVSDEKAPA